MQAMAIQTVFKRYEMKYLLTRQQKQTLLQAMAEHMVLDQYGRTLIRSIYYDTGNYRLIRRSIDKPAYKEKLRVRSYGQPSPDSPVFVELKKKYAGVVYKRRIRLPADDAMAWLEHRKSPVDTQIAREVDYFLDFYEALYPTVLLSYEREAYAARDGSDFRVTFDDNILCRREDLSLTSPVYGTPLLPPDQVLMEIKCHQGMPLWMVKVLSREGIYKTSFSKYGTAYQTMIFTNSTQEVSKYA